MYFDQKKRDRIGQAIATLQATAAEPPEIFETVDDCETYLAQKQSHDEAVRTLWQRDTAEDAKRLAAHRELADVLPEGVWLHLGPFAVHKSDHSHIRPEVSVVPFDEWQAARARDCEEVLS